MRRQRLIFQLLVLWLLFAPVLFAMLHIPSVQATANSKQLIFEDNMDDQSHLETIPTLQSNITTVNGALIINESMTQMRGFFSEIQTTIEILFSFQDNLYSGSSGEFGIIGVRDSVGWDMNKLAGIWLGLSTTGGTGGASDFVVWRYKNTVGTNVQWNPWHTKYTNMTIYWDGINAKYSMWLNGTLKVNNWYLWNLNSSIAGSRAPIGSPIPFPNEVKLASSPIDGYWVTMNITRVRQFKSVASTTAYPVVPKVFGLNFDANYHGVATYGLDIFKKYRATATLMSDYAYQTDPHSQSLGWAETRDYIEDYGWESGTHLYRQLTSYPNWQPIFDADYSYVYGNLTAVGLSPTLAKMTVFSDMAGANNWTHTTYAWTQYGMIDRNWAIPSMNYYENMSASITGMFDDTTQYKYRLRFMRGVNEETRVFFAWTHDLTDGEGTNLNKNWLDSFMANITALGYRTMGTYAAYQSLIRAYNGSITILEETASTTRFSTSSGGFDFYVWATKPSGSGTWYVYDDVGREITITENFSDKLGFWVRHGRTYTITAARQLAGITEVYPTYASLVSASYSSSKLTFTVNAPTGNTSITYIYAGSKSMPQTVTGSTSWSYNDVTKIVSVTKVHASPSLMEVIWSQMSDEAIASRNYIINYGYIAISIASVGFIVLVAIALMNQDVGMAYAAVLTGLSVTIGLFVTMYILSALSGI